MPPVLLSIRPYIFHPDLSWSLSCILRSSFFVNSSFLTFFFVSYLWHLLQTPRSPVRLPKTRETFHNPVFIFPISTTTSVRFQDTIIQSSSAELSVVRIPVIWCHSLIQQRRKQRRLTLRNRPSKLKKFLFPFLVLLGLAYVPTTYAIPNSNKAFVNSPSKSNSLQHKHVDSIVNPLSGVSHTQSSHLTANLTVEGKGDGDSDQALKTKPCIFLADTDSTATCIDTGASHFITNNLKSMTDVHLSNQRVKGVGGKETLIKATGTKTYSFKSDSGVVDTIRVEGVCYVPTSPYDLTPPQVLIAKLKQQGYWTDYAKHDDQIYVFTYRKLDEPKSSTRSLTVNISSNNLFLMRPSEGYNHFFKQLHAYSAEWCNWCEFAGAADVIPVDSDDESSVQKARLPREPPDKPDVPRTVSERKSQQPTEIPFSDSEIQGEEIPNAPKEVDFRGSESKNTETESPDASVEIIQRKKARLATIHETLGHISFTKLKLLARCGLIPRDLANVEPPVCPGCAYGKAHRRAWAYKGIKNRKPIRQATTPGEVVSMDQLVSPTEGFVPTHRGKPTKQRYVGATVFVDHYSDYTYIHLMTKMDAESTVEAKLEFERHARSFGVTIRHYHADNGLFDTKLFKECISRSNQTLSFCGVNAHHQNGKAENRIKDVTTNSRTSLLHAAHRWPKAISPALWPAALKHYTNLRNALPTEFKQGGKQGRKKLPDQYENSPLSKFSGTEVQPNLTHFHPFGSPVYVLENALQQQHSHNKWSDRSRVGIYMCHSPQHASNVSLVLNTQTGNVSPQFHCIFDDSFETCKRDAKFQSLWQYKAKLQNKSFKFQIPREDFTPTHPYQKFVQHKQSASPSSTLPDPTPLGEPFQEPFVSEEDQEQAIGPNEDEPDDNENRNSTTSNPPSETSEISNDPPRETVQITRSGRQVRPPNRFDDSHHSALSCVMSFLHAFSPASYDSQVEVYLLQPDIESHAEPHPFALFVEHVQAFIGSDPDTMHYEDAMRQPD